MIRSDCISRRPLRPAGIPGTSNFLHMPAPIFRKSAQLYLNKSILWKAEDPDLGTISGTQPKASYPSTMNARENHDMNVSAAGHYIQHDFHQRRGNTFEAKMHKDRYDHYRKLGANPQREHFREAMQTLPSHFRNIMKGWDIKKDFESGQKEETIKFLQDKPKPLPKLGEKGYEKKLKEIRQKKETLKL